MNRIKLLSIVTGAVFILTMVYFLGNPVIIGAAEKCAIVQVRSHAGVEPEVLKVTKGDCVVWINWTAGEDVKIIFREGKKCADNTKAPVGFRTDSSSCYLTDYLAFGQTSSLMFPTAGTFNYEVEFQREKGKTVRGAIQVK